MVDMKQFGENLAALRKKQGLTGERFAELLGVSPQAVSKWETGKKLPETALLPAISKQLSVSVDSLLIPRKYSVKHYLGGCYIDGIPSLKWGRMQDCTWAGCMQILLNAFGITLTYADIMGYSGSCYFFSMTKDWCPSAAMPHVLYDPAAVLERTAGVTRASISSERMDACVQEAICSAKPVMLIQPRVEMEWGILCGYTGDRRFYGRSYFDYLKPGVEHIFTDNYYFLADCYSQADPHYVYILQERTFPLPIKEALKSSLETALSICTAAPQFGNTFYFGMDAYDILVDSLRLEDSGFAALTQYGATGNGYNLLARLLDARRAARDFWTEKFHLVPGKNGQKLRNLAVLYGQMVSELNKVVSDDIAAATLNGYPFKAWSQSTRLTIADVLDACKEYERQAIILIEEVLAHW